MQSRKINASACGIFAMSIADLLLFADLFYPKNAMLANLLLMLTTLWHKSRGSCVWAFWGVLHSQQLTKCWVLNNFYRCLPIVVFWERNTTLSQPVVVYCSTTCSPNLKTNLADWWVFGLAELLLMQSSLRLKTQSNSSARWFFDFLFWCWLLNESSRDMILLMQHHCHWV